METPLAPASGSILRLAESWRRSLEASNRSPRTIDGYLITVRLFATFLPERGHSQLITAVTRDDIEAYQIDLLTRSKPSTVQTRHKGLKVFFGWLVDEDEITVSPMDRVKPVQVPEEPVRVLSTDEGVTEPGPVPPVPEGQTVRDVIAEQIRSHHRSSRGVDLERFSTEEVTSLQQYNLFPNATVLVSADLVSVLVAVPGLVADRAELVAMHFERSSSAEGARSRPFDATVPFDHTDFGAVLNQDLALLKHAQVGVRQPGLTHLTLSGEEIRIINMHRTLERFLGDDPAALPGGAMIG